MDKEEKKTGRKDRSELNSSGERVSFHMYLNKDLYDKARFICLWKGVSMISYASGLIDSDVKKSIGKCLSEFKDICKK